jgi:hypothetical protein
MGYQEKGWTDGEIGAAWMKIFEAVTRKKANGKWRLLIVDGHNSHYTVAFLLMARLNMVIVICYPAHGTHIFQGLDVVIFSVLKLYLSQERDNLLRSTGKAIDKSNFNMVYAKAYTRALTPENIKSAFRKTGIVPFNPDVVTPEMMAPSKETSSEAHLPVESSDGVKIIANLLRKLQIQENASDSNSNLNSNSESEGPNSEIEDESEAGPSNQPITTQTSRSSKQTTTLDILKEAVEGLKTTNLAFLATAKTTTTSSDIMPSTATCTATELAGSSVNTTTSALMIQPSTKNELLLLAALREAENRNQRSEVHTFELQAANILNEAYVDRLVKKLAAQEEKQAKKKKKTTRLVGDGLPRLLTGDEFYEMAKGKEREAEEAARQKEVRKDGRSAYKVALERWKVAEQERKDAKAVASSAFQKELAAWERKRDAAKKKGKKITDLKPKRPVQPAALVRPKLKDFLEGGGDEGAADGDEEEADEEETQESEGTASDA